MEDNRHLVRHLEHKIRMDSHKEHQLDLVLHQARLGKTPMESHRDLQLDQANLLEESPSLTVHQELAVLQIHTEHLLAHRYLSKVEVLLLLMVALKS